jgi:hypothetical protein
MSAGFPYLQKQRKSDLTDIASSVGLKEYISHSSEHTASRSPKGC